MTALIVDGNNALVRAMRATERSGMSAKGVPTGATLVFINVLSRHIKAQNPERVAVCWDGGQSRRRLALYPAYKAERRAKRASNDEPRWDPTPHFDLAKEFLSLANVHHLQHAGVEADDLIAALWRVVDGDKVILSGDKDFLQLLDEHTTQVRPQTDSDDWWGRDRVRREFGVPPHWMPYVMALAGDSIDGVPGVRGLGPKRAATIVTEVEGVWEAVLAHPKVVDHVEDAILSLALVDLRTAVDGESEVTSPPPFAPTRRGSALWQPLLDWCEHYEMATVAHRLHEDSLWGSTSDLAGSGRLP